MASRREKKVSPRGRRAAAAEPEAVEEAEGGIGIDDGIVLGTSLLLAIALVLVIVALGIYPQGPTG